MERMGFRGTGPRPPGAGAVCMAMVKSSNSPEPVSQLEMK